MLISALTKITPVFETSKDVTKFIGKYNITDKIENMMAVRWHVFNFTQQITCEKQKV